MLNFALKLVSVLYACTIVLNICVGKTVNLNSHPSSNEHMYEEVGVTGEVKRSQVIFNEAYGSVVKDSIETSVNSAYEQMH